MYSKQACFSKVVDVGLKFGAIAGFAEKKLKKT